MPPRALGEIKIGDRVWVSARYGNNDRGTLKTVVHLTPTQIILDGIKEYNRYQRGKKSRYGDELTYYGIGMSEGRITFIATPEECAKWDADLLQKQQEAEAARAKREQREAKRQELSALFGKNINVQDTHTNEAGEWQVCMWADEAGVRRLAELLNAPEAGSGDNNR